MSFKQVHLWRLKVRHSVPIPHPTEEATIDIPDAYRDGHKIRSDQGLGNQG